MSLQLSADPCHMVLIKINFIMDSWMKGRKSANCEFGWFPLRCDSVNFSLRHVRVYCVNFPSSLVQAVKWTVSQLGESLFASPYKRTHTLPRQQWKRRTTSWWHSVSLDFWAKKFTTLNWPWVWHPHFNHNTSHVYLRAFNLLDTNQLWAMSELVIGSSGGGQWRTTSTDQLIT